MKDINSSHALGARMNIRYLEIMEAIAETGTFTGAAKRLFITQSAVSHAVAELEAQAGTALFARLPKGVVLTPCGASLLEESRGILIACRNLERRLPHLEERTPLHVVSSITIASFLLPQLLRPLQRNDPELIVSVKVASANTVIDILRHGDADLAFWEGSAPKGEFEIIPLGSYRLQAACSPDFPVSSQSLSLGQLCQYPLLLRERGSAIRDTFDSVLTAANLRAEPAWESVNSASLAKAAEAGLGIAILPEQLLSDAVAASRLRLIKIRAAGLENQMLALFHRGQYVTKTFRRLLDALKHGSMPSQPGG